MNFQKLKALCDKKGITEIEVYNVRSVGASIRTFNLTIDQNIITSSNKILVRGVYNNHIASLNVEKDTEDELEFIVDKLIQNASVIESEDPYFIYGGSDFYETIDEVDVDFDSYTQADKIELCKKMETYLKENCEFVTTTQAFIASEEEIVTIENSKGLSVRRESKDAVIGCVAVIKKDNDVKQGYFMDHVTKLSEIDYDKLYAKAIKRPLDSIGAKSIPSGSYPVVFENTTACSLLSCFTSMFCGDVVVKKLSLLEGKINQKVFGDNITIIDNPLHKDSHARYTFDDEGVATKEKVLVDGGVLKSYLTDLKAAKMLDVNPTGNGFKDSNGGITVSPCNMYLKNDDVTFDDMIKDIENGLLITGLMGQHAGVNSVSGAFNLQASGFKIENGKVSSPVTLIIVSGNILDLLNNVKCISNDFEFAGKVGTGSIFVSNLSVSGK